MARIAKPRIQNIGIALVGCAFLAACGATQSNGRPPEQPHGAYEATCKYVGLQDAPGFNDQNADSVALTAAYRFGEPAPKKKSAKPLELSFQNTRSRVTEQTQYLAARPEVICRPEGSGSHYASPEPQSNNGLGAAQP
jgi:hypothetical protein